MSVATQKIGMSVREVIQQLLTVEDLDVPFLTHKPKIADSDDGEGEEEDRGIIIDADNTSPVLYVSETANGVVVSEQMPAE